MTKYNNTHNLLEIGNNIRNIRLDKGFSQEELAFKANLHRTYIGAVERGEKNITVLNLIKIANALNVPPNFFLILNSEDD